jgi:hypothetical protein
LPPDRRILIPQEGAIPAAAQQMPSGIDYDASARRLRVGLGYVENVPPEVWSYEVSGKHVVRQWFSYRAKDRDRPVIGDRRPPSPLGEIQPDHWLPEYTTELLNLLNLLALLVELEPAQAELLDRVCSGPLISLDDLTVSGALEPGGLTGAKRKTADPNQTRLVD